MGSRAGRVVLGVVLLGVAVALFAVLRSSDSGGDREKGSEPHRSAERHAPTAPTVPTIVIRGGEPVGGIRELAFTRGEKIRFRVESDVDDELHIHGYDVVKEIEAGATVNVGFPATIEGVFEGELENRGEQVLELRVDP